MSIYPTLEFIEQYKQFILAFGEATSTSPNVTVEGYMQWLTHRRLHEALTVIEEIDEKITSLVD